MESVLMGNMGAVTFTPENKEMVEYVTMPKSGSDVAIEVPVPSSAPVITPTKVVIEEKKESGLGKIIPYVLGAGVLYYLLFANKK